MATDSTGMGSCVQTTDYAIHNCLLLASSAWQGGGKDTVKYMHHQGTVMIRVVVHAEYRRHAHYKSSTVPGSGSAHLFITIIISLVPAAGRAEPFPCRPTHSLWLGSPAEWCTTAVHRLTHSQSYCCVGKRGESFRSWTASFA